MIDCVVDIFSIACFRALGLSPSSWGLWHSGCVMNTPEMQGSWFELFFTSHSVSQRNVHCVLNTHTCWKCPELYQWGKKSLWLRGNPARKGACWLLTTIFRLYYSTPCTQTSPLCPTCTGSQTCLHRSSQQDSASTAALVLDAECPSHPDRSDLCDANCLSVLPPLAAHHLGWPPCLILLLFQKQLIEIGL